MKRLSLTIYLLSGFFVMLIAVHLYQKNLRQTRLQQNPPETANLPTFSPAEIPTPATEPLLFEKPEQVTNAFFDTYLSLSPQSPDPQQVRALIQAIAPDVHATWSASGSAFVTDLNRFVGVPSIPISFTTEVIKTPQPESATIIIALYYGSNAKTLKAVEVELSQQRWQITKISPYRLNPQIIR